MPNAAFISVYNVPGMSAKGLRGVVSWLRRQADYMQKHPHKFSNTTYEAAYDYQPDTYKAIPKKTRLESTRHLGGYVFWTKGNTWGGYGADKKKIAKPPVSKTKRKKAKKKPKKRRTYY